MHVHLIPALFFHFHLVKGYGCANVGVISQQRLKIEVKLLLNANWKSYMPRRLTQQQMTLSDLEWLFHGTTSSASRAISAVAELVVAVVAKIV